MNLTDVIYDLTIERDKAKAHLAELQAAEATASEEDRIGIALDIAELEAELGKDAYRVTLDILVDPTYHRDPRKWDWGVLLDMPFDDVLNIDSEMTFTASEDD